MNKPKILLFDIEAAPTVAYTWSLWDQNIGLDQVIDNWFMLSFCAKWLGEKDVVYMDQSTEKDIENDYNALKKLNEMLDEADVVVAHNGRKFDVKKVNTRFLMHNLPIPSPYKIVDTLEIVKKNFAFTSNKLEYLTDQLCKKKKLKHAKFPGFKLWKECMNGNPAAWKEMRKYNIMDVLSLEELYLALRPWDKISPNHGVYMELGKHVCSKCGSHKLQSRGYAYTQIGKYQRFQCNSCGGWSRARQMENSKETRDVLLTNCQ